MSDDDAGSAVALPLDASQERAYALALSGANVALFGRAGSGKSEVARRMITAARAKWGAEHVAVGALAGSAALVIGGQTLHSLFGMDTRPLSSQAWLKETLGRPHVVRRLNALRVLFVDEVCTISSSLFMRLAFVMRRVAPPHLQHRPFAGCQVVAAGDPLQVAPVKVTDTSMDRFVFDCSSWRATFGGSAGSVVCLTGSHRQASDGDFQSALDRVRWGRAGDATIKRINATWTNAFSGPVTQLRILKNVVLDINEAMLMTIESPSYIFQARDVFETTDPVVMQQAVEDLRSCVDLSLELKPSALVILTRKMQGVPAGSRGILIEIVRRTVLTGPEAEEVIVAMCDFGGKVVEVTRARFSAYNSAGDEVAHCEQMPLILGWAMTVHRSQGLTLEAVEIDFELDNWVTCGLVYTALSRVRSFSSLRVRGLRRGLVEVSRCAVAYYEKKLLECGIDPSDDGRPPIEVGTL